MPGIIALLVGFIINLHAETNLTDFPTSLLPPPTGSYDCAGTISFPNGVMIDSLSLRLPSASQAPPAAGSSSTVSFSATARFRKSSDYGKTYISLSGTADVTVRYSSSAGSTGYDTELLQLNLTQGGTGGLLLRESPTLASTGQTTIKSRADGTYRISSFFDIFTECSLDSGQSWVPAMGSFRCNLAAPSSENTFSSNQLPPSASTHTAAASITYPSGVVIRNLSLSNPTQPVSPPTPGGSQFANTPLTVTGEMSSNGTTYQPFTVDATATVRVTSQLDSGSTRDFDTEMLALNLSGGTLPGGVMVRESPTKQSLGRTSVRTGADNQFHISSFFDIFTELSVDGGATWSPASSGCCTCAFIRESPTRFFTSSCTPLPAHYVTDTDEAVSFGTTGVVIRNFTRTPQALRAPLQAPGTQQTVQTGGSTEFDLSRDGGVTFQHYYLESTMENDIVSCYSVIGGEELPKECVSFDITVAGPSPVMVRESPSKASLGRTSVRSAPGGYMISSFFDIFTEVSLDGGQSWTPASDALHASILPYVEQDNVFSSNFLPPRDGSYQTRANDPPVTCANGMRLRNVSLQGFPDSQPPPEVSDGTRGQDFQATLSYELSSDGGTTWTPTSATCSGNFTVTVRDSLGNPSGRQSYDTEMLSLNMSGGTLQGGVMIRESPTKQSLGKTTVRSTPTGGVIDSFFDVFLELSMDSGTNWSPAYSAVHLELHRPPSACFTRSDWLPADLVMCEPDQDFATRFPPSSAGSGRLIKELQYARYKGDMVVASGAVSPPASGSSATCTVSIPVSFSYSPDDGASFTPVQCDASAVLQYSNLTTSPDGSERDMTCEMLSLSLSGGTLPGGVMVRESPTKQSLGKHAIRSAAGGFRVSSFFDVFLELSTDGGQSWTPACDTTHIECRESPTRQHALSVTQLPLVRLTSPPGGTTLRCATGQHIAHAELNCKSKTPVTPPPPGSTATPFSDATIDFDYSDDGMTFQHLHGQAFLRYQFTDVMVGSDATTFDTEMLQLETAGNGLPTGMRLRESPTKQSLGKTSCFTQPDGSCRVCSFFDVFLELSTDGGQTWQPFDRPMFCQFEDDLASSAVASQSWPPPGQLVMWPVNGDLDFNDQRFSDGSALSFFDIFTEPSAGQPPLPTTVGASADIVSSGTCRFHIDRAAGSPPLDVTCSSSCTVRFTATGTFPDGTSSFDADMLSLSLTGGTLPAGMRVRESPIKQPLGRHTVRMSSGGGGGGGGGFMVSSFFDVFLELSTDSGKTWLPASSPVRLAFAAPQISVEQPSGSALASGSSTVAFPPVLTGGVATRSFVIRNAGSMDLSLSSVTIDGADANSFSIAAPPVSPVSAAGTGSSLVVSCSSNMPGTKSATLHIASDDPSAGTFSISLSGHVLSPHADDNGNGIDNSTELALAPFGFDPLADNSSLIAQLRSNGFYRSSDMQSLALGHPLLQKDPQTGHFHLSLGVLRSPNLSGWQPLSGFSVSPPSPASGRFDIDITPSGSNAQFYRVFGEPPAQ